jgi:hypothetical protein
MRPAGCCLALAASSSSQEVCQTACMFARANNQSVCCSSFIAGGSFKAVNETFVEHWVADEECGANLLQLEGPDGIVRQVEGEEGVVHNLFAFPAEDNFAGVLAGCCSLLSHIGVLLRGCGHSLCYMWVLGTLLSVLLRGTGAGGGGMHNLFAFPAEDNFAGVLAGCGLAVLLGSVGDTAVGVLRGGGWRAMCTTCLPSPPSPPTTLQVCWLGVALC